MLSKHCTHALVLTGLVVIGCGRNDTRPGGRTPPAGAAATPAKAPDAGDAAAKAAAVKLVSLDLSSAGLPLVVQAPEGSTVESPFKTQALVKKAGTPFELVISEGDYDMAKQKAGYQKDKPNYLIDKPNELFVETKAFSTPTYFFDAIYDIGGKKYHVRDGRNPVDREQAELIARSAKTLAAKK